MTGAFRIQNTLDTLARGLFTKMLRSAGVSCFERQ